MYLSLLNYENILFFYKILDSVLILFLKLIKKY
jgi:hypothetical protein